MATNNDFRKIIKAMDGATAQFERVAASSERYIYNEVLTLAKDIELNGSGNIKPSTANLKRISTIRQKLKKISGNAEYLKGVKSLLDTFDSIYNQQLAYFHTLGNITSTQKHEMVKKLAVENTIDGLAGAGLQANVTNKISDILLRAVTTSAKYSDLTKELQEFLTETDNGKGELSKYATTYATTAMTQYVGQNNKLFTDDLGLEWFQYVGSNIETTREFCEHLTKKEYIHKSEIPTILKGEIDGHKCKIYEKTGLPQGMIDGTTEENFQVYVGGWNCRHQLVPIAKEAVPENVRAKFEKAKQEIKEQQKAERNTFFERQKNTEPMQKTIKVDGRNVTIKTRFDKKEAYKHLYNDVVFGRAKNILTKDDLPKLNEYFEQSKFIKSSMLYKKRKDDFKHFYYFETNVRGKKVYFNVGKNVFIRKNGKAVINMYLYAITDNI